MRLRVLIVSNGHGEDAMGSLLAERLIAIGAVVEALPVVGEGKAYKVLGVPIIAPAVGMPSGGFGARAGQKALWADLRAGLIAHLRSQIAALRASSHRFDVAVGLGDIVVVALARMGLGGLSFVFLPTAKSEHSARHNRIERSLMRRACKIFTRDAVTADALSRHGLPAEFVGNLMMDLIRPTGRSLPFRPDAGVIALLPGSRDEAYGNLALLLPVAEAMDGVEFPVALAGNLDASRAAQTVQSLGWVEQQPGTYAKKGGARVHLLTGAFYDILQVADVVVGMAGTANEQAVGCGIPVVAFPGSGTQFTPRFLAEQKRLLGDALAVCSGPTSAAQEVRKILSDPHRYERMARVGRERMGGPGGVDRVVLYLCETFGPKNAAGNSSAAPEISVVIPTYNRRELLGWVLDSLAKQTYPSDRFEVVVVDDGSTDGTVEMLKERAGNSPYLLRVVPSDHGGRSRTRNTGILAAAGGIVILLDSDVVVAPEFVAGHAWVHGRAPTGGLNPDSPTGTSSLSPPNRTLPLSRVIGHGPVVNTPDPRGAMESGSHPRLSDLSTAFFATANVSVARKHLTDAGLFDESFVEYGWEDLELGDRLRALGLKAVPVPEAKGYHYVEPNSHVNLNGLIRRELERGHMAVLFHRKHPTARVRMATWLTPVAFGLDRLLSLGRWPEKERTHRWAAGLGARGGSWLLPAVLKLITYHYYVEGLREGLAGRLGKDHPRD